MSKLEKLLFKDVKLWVLGLVVTFMLFFSLMVGYGVLHVRNGGKKLGPIGPVIYKIVKTPDVLTDMLKEARENPRLAPDQRFAGQNGFFFSYKPGERPDAPYLLLNRYDQELGQSVSELIDLNAQDKVHTWVIDVEKVVRDHPSIKKLYSNDIVDDNSMSKKRLRNVHAFIFSDGSLIMQNDSPFLKCDLSGNVLWLNSERKFHHSIEPDSEGNIWVPSRIFPPAVDVGAKYNKKNVLNKSSFHDDAITKLSSEGKILFSKSVTHLLDENGLGALVYGRGIAFLDPIHLNDIQEAPADSKYWKKGDLFISLRNQSMVMLYRPSTNRIIWYSIGPWLHQHDVYLIDNSKIGVFNNNARMKGKKLVVDGNSEYIIFDFETKKYSQPFSKGMKKLDIKTQEEGRGRPYLKDLLYIEETKSGRLIVFDEDGDVEWQYINGGKDGKTYYLAWSRFISRETGDSVRKLVNK